MAAQQRGSYMEEKPQYDAGGETFPILPDMNPLMPFHFSDNAVYSVSTTPKNMQVLNEPNNRLFASLES